MSSFYQPVRITSHPYASFGSDYSRYHERRATRLHLVPTTRQYPSRYSRRYTVVVAEQFGGQHVDETASDPGLPDISVANVCDVIRHQIMDHIGVGCAAASTTATPVVHMSPLPSMVSPKTSLPQQQQPSVVGSGLLSDGNIADRRQQPQHAMSKSTSTQSPTDRSRGVKRRTEQDAMSPTSQKKRRPSDAMNKENENPTAAVAVENNVSTSVSVVAIDFKNVSEIIMSFSAVRQQDKDLYVSKMKLRDALYDVIKRIFPYCGLYVIGSSMNGFGNSSSDMDMCLMLSHTEIDQKREATDILRILHKSLSKCNFLQSLRLIHARVPILKFRDKISGVECDLNINNSVGIRNTHLLNAYSCLDWRLAPLVLFVKRWAKVQGINDASHGTISSYSLVLMVIHYLQYGCCPPVLPSLQQKYPHKFNGTQDVRALTLNQKLAPYVSPNQQSIGELFVGFLRYLAYNFKFDSDVMSVRLGRTLSREAVLPQQTDPLHAAAYQWKYLCIEEPFNLSNTAYSVHDAYTFERIRRVFKQSLELVQQTGDIEPIVSRSLVPF